MNAKQMLVYCLSCFVAEYAMVRWMECNTDPSNWSTEPEGYDRQESMGRFQR